MLRSKLRAVWGVIVLAAGMLVGCVSAPPPTRIAACMDADLSIYFADNSAEVTAPARAVIADAGQQAARCKVREVEVVGLADYRGPPEPNLALSRQRAQAVAGALEKVGLPVPRFTVTAQGEAGAIAAPGVAEPMRRRAEVFIRYAGPAK